jgi:hypothetical protein
MSFWKKKKKKKKKKKEKKIRIEERFKFFLKKKPKNWKPIFIYKNVPFKFVTLYLKTYKPDSQTMPTLNFR